MPPSPTTTVASEDCPITQPNGQAPPGEKPNPHFLGNGQLWTLLPSYTAPDAIRHDGALVKKIPWWEGEAVTGEPLEISGMRLDGSAPLLEARALGLAQSAGHQFQPSLLAFPTAGCWRVTGRAGSATLTFTIRVQTDCKTNRCLARHFRSS